MEKLESGRGGARIGAGKPKGTEQVPPELKRVGINRYRIEKWLYDFLNSQKEPGGQIIERLLIEHYGLKRPDIKIVKD